MCLLTLRYVCKVVFVCVCVCVCVCVFEKLKCICGSPSLDLTRMSLTRVLLIFH